MSKHRTPASANAVRLAPALIGGALLIAPYPVVQALLYVEYKSHSHAQGAELIILIVGVASGVIGLWLLPARRLVRGLLTLPYIALAAAATWVTALPAVCGYFGDCL